MSHMSEEERLKKLEEENRALKKSYSSWKSKKKP